MKSLSLSSPMVIMVVGLPGAGKSFFARSFAQTFGAPIVSEDKVRYTLFANHTYSKDENAMIGQVSDMIIDELFVAGKTFILDGGYNSRVARENMTAIASKHGFRTLTIWVQTDEITCKKRAIKRSEKRDGDQYKQSLTLDQFESFAKRLTPPNPERDAVVISRLDLMSVEIGH